MKKELGVEGTWKMCNSVNGTHLDCPISDYNLQNGSVVDVYMHNPSTNPVTLAKIAVPNGNFRFMGFNTSTLEFEANEKAEVHCHLDYIRDSNGINNCKLFASVDLAAGESKMFRLEYNSSYNITVENRAAKESDSIQDDHYYLSLGSMDAEEGLINFVLADSQGNEAHDFDFSLRYWPSYVKFDGNPGSSGAYAFRPIAHLYYPLPWSSIQQAEVSVGNVVSRFTFYFSKENDDEELERYAIVNVYLEKDLGVVRFDVDLGSLPNVFIHGYEVVASFSAHSFDNEGVFYTDANGLEMQKRKLNYRSYYDIAEKQYNHMTNISANYYPVNQAISIKDTKGNKQFTVMNSVAQGGSSLDPGRIEFMQNRRLPIDDNKGVGEVLNETDSTGEGIRVPSSYFLQLHSLDRSPSYQRVVQIYQDLPVQYFFSNNTNQTVNETQAKPVSYGSEDVDFSKVKVLPIPMAKNKALIRLENLADLFDSDSKTVTYDLKGYLTEAWANANNGTAGLTDIEIVETSITGNQKLSEMNERRLKWKTVDDDKDTGYPKQVFSFDLDESAVTLEPQRIRVFMVEFKTASQETLEFTQ